MTAVDWQSRWSTLRVTDVRSQARAAIGIGRADGGEGWTQSHLSRILSGPEDGCWAKLRILCLRAGGSYGVTVNCNGPPGIGWPPGVP